MLITVEGRKNWSAERAFVEAFQKEVEGWGCKTKEAFLELVGKGPFEGEFLFLEGILPLIDSRTSMSKEAKLISYWFMEQRRIPNQVIVLSDVFDITGVDVRIRRMVTHRVYLATGSKYRILSLSTGRAVGGKLDKGTILEAIKESNRPFTKKELAKMAKATNA